MSSTQNPQYRPRQPEKTDLYLLLLDHLESFLAERDGTADPERGYLRSEVREALESYLECGRLRFGFARLKCATCGQEKLLALSCQRRGICPSCHAKRVTIWSDDLIENVLPDVAYRQWSITIPKRLRVFFRYDSTLFKGLSRIFGDILTHWMQTVMGRDDVRPAVIACDQSFGTLLGYHPHQHLIVSDGVFTSEGEYIAMTRLRKKDRRALEEALQRRILLWLTRKGKLSPATRRSMRAWPHSGFHVDGSVRVPAGRRERLRKVLCYAHRHPFRADGVIYNAETGTVIYRSNKRHGKTRSNFEAFDAVDFIAAIADHIPHRRRHRVRYYGALHPRYRSSLPTPTDLPDQAMPAHIAKLGRRHWARLLWRVYEVDVLECDCGGHFRIISIIRHDPVVPAILEHLGLPTELPCCKPARASPEHETALEDHFDPCIDPPAWEEPAYDAQTGRLMLG